MVSYARKAIYGATTVFTLSLVSALTAYLFRFLLARKLTVADYGLFFALFAFINLLGLFKDLGLGYALLKFVPELKVKKNWNKIKSLITSSFIIQLTSSGIITVLILVFANVLAQEFFHTDQTFLITLFAFVFLLSFPQNIVSVCFQSFQRMFFFAVQDLTRNVLVLIMAYFLLKTGMGVAAPAWAYVFMYAIVFIIFFAVFTRLVFKQFWKAKTIFVSNDFSSLLLFGFPAMLTIFGNNVLQYTDTLMLTYLTDLTRVGLYQVAVPLAMLVLYVAHATATVTTPLIAELAARKKRKELRNGIELLHKYLFIAVIPASVVLIAFPEIFIRLFFGEKYLGAAIALQVLGGGMVLYTLAHVNLGILFGLGKPRYNTFVMMLAALVNVILNAALIPLYGIIGAASATTTSFLLLLVLSSKGIKRSVKTRTPWHAWVKTLSAAIVLVFVLAGIKTLLTLNPWAELALGIVIGGLVYCGLVFLLKIITKNELQWLRDQLAPKTLAGPGSRHSRPGLRKTK